MNKSAVLASPAESLLGADGVHTSQAALAQHALDGLSPSVVAVPDTSEGVAEVLKWAHKDGLGVVVWGSGSRIGLGARPSRYDIAISLSRLNRIMEHDVENLTLTAQAGVTLLEAAHTTVTHNQMLAAGWPWSRRTVGGLISANRPVPKRLLYGSVRDQLLGVRIALAEKGLVGFGGKVLKNVAGYDMTKLVIGSLGSLGVIVEATFKLFAIPHRETYLAAALASPILAAALATRLANGPLRPACLFLLSPLAAERMAKAQKLAGAAREWTLVAGFDGRSEAIRRQIADARALITQAGGDPRPACDTIGEAGGRCLTAEEESPPSVLRLRVGVAPGDVGDTLAYLETESPGDEPIDAVADHPGGAITLLFSLPEHPGESQLTETAGRIERIRAWLDEHAGFAVLEQAPAPYKSRISPWGRSSGAERAMGLIKSRLDPKGILAPGRFPEMNGHLGPLS